MTAYEIYKEINTASHLEYYEMANLMEYDTEGASKLIQDYFKCDKETADESIAIMNKAVEDRLRSKGIEPLTREQKALNNEAERLARQNKPKCPTCQSTNLKKISTTSKVVNTAMWGIYGTKRHKTFHCNHCGYEW